MFTNNLHDLTLWHQQMAHVNIDVIKRISQHAFLQDFKIHTSHHVPSVCVGCAFGKHYKASYRIDPHKQRSQILGELLYVDMCGKMTTPSLGKAIYFILVKDNCIFYRFVYFLKHKNEAFSFFEKTLHLVQHDTGNKVWVFRIN